MVLTPSEKAIQNHARILMEKSESKSVRKAFGALHAALHSGTDADRVVSLMGDLLGKDCAEADAVYNLQILTRAIEAAVSAAHARGVEHEVERQRWEYEQSIELAAAREAELRAAIHEEVVDPRGMEFTREVRRGRALDAMYGSADDDGRF